MAPRVTTTRREAANRSSVSQRCATVSTPSSAERTEPGTSASAGAEASSTTTAGTSVPASSTRDQVAQAVSVSSSRVTGTHSGA